MIIELSELNNYFGFITEVVDGDKTLYGCGTLALYNLKNELDEIWEYNTNKEELDEIKKHINEDKLGTSKIDDIEEYIIDVLSHRIVTSGSFINTSPTEIIRKLNDGSIFLCALEVPSIKEKIGHIGLLKMSRDGLILDNVEIKLKTLNEIRKSNMSEFIEFRISKEGIDV